tara:strand:- start:2049 stop:2183 length:135 start_codon:yes stop_codon:yes gene_type:complete
LELFRDAHNIRPERVRRIELPSSAWKAEVLAVELHPQAYDVIGF